MRREESGQSGRLIGGQVLKLSGNTRHGSDLRTRSAGNLGWVTASIDQAPRISIRMLHSPLELLLPQLLLQLLLRLLRPWPPLLASTWLGLQWW